VTSWSYDHFLGFLLLHASYADYEYTDDEKAHILTHINQDILEDVEAHFDTLGEYKQLDVILSLKRKFIHSSDDKEKVLQILKSHFKSDGDYSRLETNLYNFLSKLL